MRRKRSGRRKRGEGGEREREKPQLEGAQNVLLTEAEGKLDGARQKVKRIKPLMSETEERKKMLKFVYKVKVQEHCQQAQYPHVHSCQVGG